MKISADTTYELPVEFELYTANTSEVKTAHQLIDRMAFENPKKLEVAQYFLGDNSHLIVNI